MSTDTVNAWQTLAACAELDQAEADRLFFPERGRSVAPAKAICAHCPVREECLEYALDNVERFGIWGGMSERERKRLRRQRSGRTS